MPAAYRPAAAPNPHVRRWIRHELATAPPRASSLIITVWGDAIAPHGGAAFHDNRVWVKRAVAV